MAPPVPFKDEIMKTKTTELKYKAPLLGPRQPEIIKIKSTCMKCRKKYQGTFKWGICDCCKTHPAFKDAIFTDEHSIYY